MQEKSSDTKVPLEWNDEGKYWSFPLMEHDWVELKGLLSKNELSYSQVSSEKYHIERSPRGEYRILWTAPLDEWPSKVYGLVAFRPKAPGTFLGIPIAVLIPIVTALATASGTIAVQSIINSDSPLSCTENKDFVSSAEYNSCTSELAIAKKSEQELNNFALNSPYQDRFIYLLARSHGQRLEALKKLNNTSNSSSDISVQAENAYIQNVLKGDINSPAYSKGLNDGQSEAIRLLGLGDLKVLSGQDIWNSQR
ncbi:hypothetical protein [Methylomonas sp. 11b]|uniref:hypothetical protein n=1 Tax=Methylomonas sp. 11b TaxID=1168169 RepID=UPI000478A0C8|nr:hypothetical protein [Methylomonas sp. 11b]